MSAENDRSDAVSRSRSDSRGGAGPERPATESQEREVSERVRDILVPRLAVVLGVDAALVTDDLELATLGLSSLEVMEMVYDAEDQLDVVFREEALAEVTTVGGLVVALAAELVEAPQ